MIICFRIKRTYQTATLTDILQDMEWDKLVNRSSDQEKIIQHSDKTKHTHQNHCWAARRDKGSQSLS